MRIISIDGACRRNGKPDCTASGGVFCLSEQFTTVLSAYEYCSTNQRGEMLALLKALDFICADGSTGALVVTDSEYLFNAMTKQWYRSWAARDWKTAAGEPVKNRDIWQEVLMAVDRYESMGLEPVFYHIKGHCIPFGRVTAENLLKRDPTGAKFYEAVLKKFDECASTKADTFKAAQDLSERNNGYKLDPEVFRRFVAVNTTADAIATMIVDAADNRRKR